MNRTQITLSAIALLMILTVTTLAKDITVRGKLQKTVESGGWVIVTDKQKYLILNPQKFQDEKWFKEGSAVEATGETKEVMTTFMEGTPFEVHSLRPLTQNESAATSADGPRLTRVMVIGDSMVQAQPDTAAISLSVVTQKKGALEAQQENASKTDTVIRALKAAAGPTAEIKTGGYSLQPQRAYREGQPATITGYEARNTVTVSLSDLNKVGTIIDVASQAGVNDIGGIEFTLRQDRPARDRALGEATREAISKAQVIAQALNGKVSRIVEVQEQGFQPPRPLEYERASAMAKVVTTPIVVGSIDVTSRVQLVAEIEL